MLEVLERLEQRDDVDARQGRLPRQVHQPPLTGQQQHAQQIVGGPGARHDVRRRRRSADLVLDRPHDPKHLQHPIGGLRQRDMRRVQRPPAAELATQGGGVQLAQSDRRGEVMERARVNAGVFTQIEAIPVEPVGPHLR